MNTRVIFITFLILIGIDANAQLTKSFHHSFEIDSVNFVGLDIQGETEITYWEGNTILTETKVEIYDASPNIFKHLVKNGRYDLEFTELGKKGSLKHKQLNRKPVILASGECYEVVKVKIYLPDVFEIQSDQIYQRTTPTVSIPK